MRRPIAAVTMVYNEPEFLPIWLRHYGREVGPENCFVVDHGSSDGSTDSLGAASRIRVPRTPKDDDQRTLSISRLCASLLCWYEWVVCCDVDELVVADPAAAASLAEFTAGLRYEVVTAVGVDVIHDPDAESPIVLDRPVGGQRRWARPVASMAKPVLARRPLQWAPGFHCADAPMVFDRLFLFHLRYFDLNQGLRRLRRTRAMAWAKPESGSHQRMADANWDGMLRSMARLPHAAGVAFSVDQGPVREWTARVAASRSGRESDLYSLDLNLSGDQLWEIPPAFRDRI